MPDRMPERMSEYMPDSMSDRLPEYMPERMSDRMSEYICLKERPIESQYIYICVCAISTSKKYVRNYVGIVCQGFWITPRKSLFFC